MTAYLANTPVLETDRLILRAPGLQDFEAFAAFMTSDRSRYAGGVLETRGQAWRAMGHVVGHWALRGFGSFAFAPKDQPEIAIGACGPWFPDDWPEHELGWTVWSSTYEGQGYAAEAALRARDYAFTELGWETAVSYIHPDNARSIALAERLGAIRDETAKRPHPNDLVYRHPPAGAQ